MEPNQTPLEVNLEDDPEFVSDRSELQIDSSDGTMLFILNYTLIDFLCLAASTKIVPILNQTYSQILNR